MSSFVPLTDDDKRDLLRVARQSIESAVNCSLLPQFLLQDFSQVLQAPGASFVTLMQLGELRGCVGAIEAYQPLVQDVCEHAVSAAMDDYRFSPVQPEDVPHLSIEISRLTVPEKLDYQEPQDLLTLLQPHTDGVVMRDGHRRATFLPQVWEKVDTVEEFLGHLSRKMGAPSDYWRRKKLEVFTYRVEMFCE
jgi:uncharacterized protein